MKKSFLMAALMAAFSTAAMAGDIYVGGTLGSATDSNPGNALTKARTTAYSLLAGYQLTDNFAVEAAYTDIGKTAQNAISLKNSATSLSAVGRVALGNSGVSALGKLGYASTRTVASTGQAASRGDLTYGLGVEYALSKNVSLRANWDQYAMGDNISIFKSREDIYSLGATYRF